MQDELSRGQVVIRAGVNPEQLHVTPNLVEHARIHRCSVRQNRLEQRPHLEVMCVTLVVIDVSTRDRGEIEMPYENLVAEIQRAEAVRVQLHNGSLVHTFEKIPTRVVHGIRAKVAAGVAGSQPSSPDAAV